MSNLLSKVSAPAPSVVHLVTLFRQIAGGEIRIPAFQREYVWNERQILSLLNSVYESFPIGSLLFWKVEKKALDVAPRAISAFPDLPEEYPLNYVLDGMQRLTTLFGVFNYEEGVTNPSLKVGFDLRTRRFSQIVADRTPANPTVPLSSLFSPKKLLEFQSRLTEEKDSENLLDSVINLQSAFQDYMIPTVTIQSGDIKRVVGIFERVNSTGTRLNSVDFMRAITWSTTFDLSKKISGVSSEIAEFGWNLKQDTIVKCAAIIMGVDVSSEALVNLRNCDEQLLHDAFDKLPANFRSTANLLYEEFGIVSPEVVSYEGQLLVAFLLCYLDDVEKVKNDFVKWFWSCGLNEQLRGKPDDYLVRLLEEWRNLPETRTITAVSGANFTPRDFLTRRLQGGSALTNTFKMLFHKSEAFDLFSREILSSSEFLSSASTSQFIPIFSKNTVAENVEGEVFSAKLYCNSILVDGRMDRIHLDPLSAIRTLLDDGAENILESQFISISAARLAIGGDVRAFLDERSHFISDFAESLIR